MIGNHAEHQNGKLLYKQTCHIFYAMSVNADVPGDFATLITFDFRCELAREFKTLVVGEL